jgi:hypothetical protein
VLDSLSRALVWADSHGLTVPVILGAVTVVARLVWAVLRPPVLRRWPAAVPVIEGAAVRVAALLPDVLAALLRRRAAPAAQADRPTIVPVAVLALLSLSGLSACPRVREAIVDTQSPRVGCEVGAQRCRDGAPEVCSSSGRWWPAMPPAADGSPRRCAGLCEVAEGVARCGVAP